MKIIITWKSQPWRVVIYLAGLVLLILGGVPTFQFIYQGF